MNRLITTKTTGLSVAVMATALALSACGGSSTNTSASSATTAAGAGQNGQGNGQRVGRVPGISGLIADVQGTTMQVQGSGEQTAVTFTSATRVTKTVPGTSSDLTVGVCVVVRDKAAGTGAAGAPTAPPTASATQATAVTATAIEVSQPVKGVCTAAGLGGGLGGRSGGGTAGAGGTPSPGGTATGTPGGGAAGTGAGRNGLGGAGFGVIGTVTAVSGSVVTVQREQRTRASGTSASGTSASGTSTTPAAADVMVTTTASTTYTVAEKGSTADVKVGECVTATGKADDTGTVAATALVLRTATNGQCTTGRRPGNGSGTATTNG